MTRECTSKAMRVALLALPFVVLAALYVAVVVVPARMSHTMSDFAALWNATDAVQQYVIDTGEWPPDWSALAPSLQRVDSSAEVAFLRQRVEVNFSVDAKEAPNTAKWYVRLKSGAMEEEQSAANERLQSLLNHIAKQPGLPDSDEGVGE